MFTKQLREQFEHLPAEQQNQVLEFARSLVKAKGSGVPGKDLLRFAGAIEAEAFSHRRQSFQYFLANRPKEDGFGNFKII